MADDEVQKSGPIFQFDPSELIKTAIATALVILIRELLEVFKWPQVPSFLKGTLTAKQLTNAVAGMVWLVIVLTIFSWKKWRNRRRHVQGKVRPGKVAIWVAELQGDGKNGEHRTNIVQTLKQELGGPVQILRAAIELRSEETGEVAEEAVAANRKAQAFLRRHKGDLLVWGQVLDGPPAVIELRFASPVHDGADELRFNYDTRFRLALGFGQELGAALAAVAAQQALPASDGGRYVAQVLVPVAEKLSTLVGSLPVSMRPDERGLLLHSYALAETTIGDQRGDSEALNRAIKAYRAALEEFKRKRVPLYWAAVQNNLGAALWKLGSCESGAEHLEEAVQAYRAALKERRRESLPLAWAATKTNLASALYTLGLRETTKVRLEEAVSGYRAALEEFTRGRDPLHWAAAQNNLGAALHTLGSRESGTARLEEAVHACQEALKERNPERFPLAWATTQTNLGNALQTLGSRESGTARLEEAVHAHRAALKVQKREHVPLEWAKTQNNLAAALQALGSRESGNSTLEEAVRAYRATLGVWTRERVPLFWAAAQNNLGNTLQTIGSREDTPARFEQAVQAYREALEELTQDRAPLEWAAVQNDLGNALENLGMLNEAMEAYGHAAKVFTREAHSQNNAVIVQNLKRVILLAISKIREKIIEQSGEKP